MIKEKRDEHDHRRPRKCHINRTLLQGSRLVVMEGARHGMLFTHADVVSNELVRFLGQQSPTIAR